MNNQEFEVMVEKAINASPDWLKTDLNNIVKKEGLNVRLSHVVSLLYNQYAFNMSHIFTSMHKDADWTDISRQRLTFIDNNLDLIDYIVKSIKKSK